MPTPDDRRARIATNVFFAVQGLTFASIITRLPEFAEKFALDEIDILLLIVLTAACAGVGSLVAGSAAARFGSAVTLRVTLVGVSLGMLAAAIAPSLPLLYVLFGVYGLFVGAVDAAMNMQGVAVQGRYGRPVMSGFWAIWSVAAVVGALYASATIELRLPLAAAALLITVVGLVLNLAFGRHLLRFTESAAAPEPGRAAHRVPWPPILLLGFVTTCFWIADAGTTNWSALYLVDELAAAPSLAPLAYAAYQATLVLTRLVGDRLVERFGPVTAARASGVVAIVGLGIVVALPQPVTAILGFGVLGCGLALIGPLSYSAAAQLDAEGSDVAVSRVNVSNYVGFIVAAVVMGVVADAASLRMAFLLPLVAVAFIAVLAGRFRSRSTSPTAGRTS